MQLVLSPPPRREYGHRGSVSDLEAPDPAAMALRLCRHGADSLAARMKPVPLGYLHGEYVECTCGYGHRRARLVECPGGCSRWFMSDDTGVWAAKLDA
jgi:hypothetical protein